MFAIAELSEERAREVCSWVYPPPWQMYNLPDWEEICASGWSLADPQRRRENWRALLTEEGELAGFFRLKGRPEGVTIGLGLAPQFCGRGLGQEVVRLVCSRAAARFPRRPVLLEVRADNARAIRCYERAGFEGVEVYRQNTPTGPADFWRMELREPPPQPLRRGERAMDQRAQQEELLRLCKVCRLALCDGDRPYLVPLNYGYSWDGSGLRLYFHSAREGRKLDLLRRSPRACFEVDDGGELTAGETACQHGWAYRSLIGEGAVRFLHGEEKRQGLEILMAHQTGRRDWAFEEKACQAVAVFCLEVSHLSGKCRRPAPAQPDV